MERLIIADIRSYNNNGKSTGHYFAVAQNYLDLYSNKYNVLIAGGPIYNIKFATTDLLKLPQETSKNNNTIKNKWYIFKNALSLFKRTTQNDIIIMQKCGTVTTFLAIILFANRKRNNIFMIEYDTEALNSKFKRLIYTFAKKKIRGFICPNETVGTAYNKPYCIVTDYIYTSQKEQVPPYFHKLYDFCVIGSIWPDKGVIEVAEKFKYTEHKLIIAGKPCNNTIKNKLESIAKESPNIILKLGYISDEDYYNYIIKSKYCILNYQGCYNERSSGVVLDVLFKYVPIIAHRCNATLLVEEEKSGYLYNSLNEFDPNTVLNENTYNKYIEGIKNFILKQQFYKNKLINFLESL